MSTITETLMGNGSWSLTLKDSTPGRIMERIYDHYSLLKVTAARVSPDTLPTVTPIYTGIRLGSDRWGEIHGAGPTWLLGTQRFADNPTEPPWFGPRVAVDRTAGGGANVTTWLNDCCKNGITFGAVGATNGNPNMPIAVDAPARALLDTVCGWWGMEYQITPSLQLYAATRNGLFGDAATTMYAVLVAKDSAGRDPLLQAWAVTDMGSSTTDEDRVDKVVSRGATVNKTVSRTPPWKAPDGSNLDVTYFEGSHTDGMSGDNVAQAAAQAAYDARVNPVQAITVSLDEYLPVGTIMDPATTPARPRFPGSNVGIYDPDRNLFDLANPVEYRGRTIYPQRIRVVGWTWPVRPGMGVYLDNRHNTGSGTPSSARVVTDLTDHIEWSDEAIQVEVGQIPAGIDGKRRLSAP